MKNMRLKAGLLATSLMLATATPCYAAIRDGHAGIATVDLSAMTSTGAFLYANPTVQVMRADDAEWLAGEGDETEEETCEEETSAVPESEAVEEKETEKDASDGKPLTPDGNLTLVDDIGSATASGKQFITMVTKNGNYFYLIIDRNDKGEENVHFLNQVDEADILALMDEDQVASYQAAQDAKDKEKEEAMKPIIPETEPAETQPAEPEKSERGRINVLPLLGVLAMMLIGSGGWFVSQAKKKKAVVMKPDPDEDYYETEEAEEEEIQLPQGEAPKLEEAEEEEPAEDADPDFEDVDLSKYRKRR